MGTDIVDEDEIMDNKGKRNDFYKNYIQFSYKYPVPGYSNIVSQNIGTNKFVLAHRKTIWLLAWLKSVKSLDQFLSSFERNIE